MNSTNSTKKRDFYCFNYFINDLISIYISEIIYVLGFLLNLICTIVFIKITTKSHQITPSLSQPLSSQPSLPPRLQMNGKKMYNYFLLKSILDSSMFFLAIFEIFYNCNECRLGYGIQFYNKYYNHYLSSCMKVLSNSFEILATLDCYVSITKRFNFLMSKKWFIVNSLTVTFISFTIYFTKIFVYEIVKDEKKMGWFHLKKTELYFSQFYKVTSTICTLYRDCLTSLILFILNLFILIELKNVWKMKLRLGNSNSTLIYALKAKEKKIRMIFFLCLNVVILHFPIIVTNFYGKFQKDNKLWQCYEIIAKNLYDLSYLNSFIIYTFFNNIFRKQLFDLKVFKMILNFKNNNNNI
jgi:hypothetical protein